MSIWLEAVTVIPQLWMIQKTGEASNVTAHYLFALGMYRGLYIVNWFYRYVVEGIVDWIAVSAGLLQTALYADFFYLYVTRIMRGETLTLPK